MNPKVKMIDVGTDFSEFPAGRYRTDGDFSGEVFREDVLVPALRDNERVEIKLDGAMGYGSSFLEEAFGGLIRVHGMSPEQLHDKLKLDTRRKSVEMEIWDYIDHSSCAA